MDKKIQTEQLEQLKKEYREIPVPEHGIDGVKAAMERATRKKRLKKRLMSYVPMAAAAMLVIFVAPAVMNVLFASGGAAMESAPDGFYNGIAKDMAGKYDKAESSVADAVVPSKEPVYQMEVPMTEGKMSAEAKEIETKTLRAKILADPVICDKIREEIASQIKIRVQKGEDAFIERFASSDARVYEPAEPEYYLNEDGLLVVRYAPGKLVSVKYGEIEFIIPDEVWK